MGYPHSRDLFAYRPLNLAGAVPVDRAHGDESRTVTPA